MNAFSGMWDDRMRRIPQGAPLAFWQEVERIEVGAAVTLEQLLTLNGLIRKYGIQLRHH